MTFDAGVFFATHCAFMILIPPCAWAPNADSTTCLAVSLGIVGLEVTVIAVKRLVTDWEWRRPGTRQIVAVAFMIVPAITINWLVLHSPVGQETPFLAVGVLHMSLGFLLGYLGFLDLGFCGEHARNRSQSRGDTNAGA